MDLKRATCCSEIILKQGVHFVGLTSKLNSTQELFSPAENTSFFQPCLRNSRWIWYDQILWRKMKKAVGDTVRLAWDRQLLQDTNNHYCGVLTPGICCCSVPGCPSLIRHASCVPEVVALCLPLFWHITYFPWECGHFGVTLYKRRKMDVFGCCSRLLLLTLKCAVKWHQFPL